MNVFLVSTLFASMVMVAGCGGSGSSGSNTNPTGPIPGESTTVAIQLSSTANDEFVHFGMDINSISLTNKAGVTTTIFNTPTYVDFIPSNGDAAPFATVKVPQDVYTSAAIAVSNPNFSYVSMDNQGTITFATDAYGYTPTPPVVNLTGPITVDGSTMGLRVDLQASPSGSYIGAPPNQTSYNINPTFNLTPFAIAAEATTPQNGKCIGLTAQVTSVGTNSMAVALAGNRLTGEPSLTVALDSTTVFQGIPSASSLSPGALINMDIALEPDASYTATRVEVPDAIATNAVAGQLVQVDPSFSYISSTSTVQEGSIVSSQPVGMGTPYVYGGSTVFQTSAQFANLSGLPFTPNFSAATLAAGQMVSAGSTTISFTGGSYTLPTSLTLVPQTIDGVVSSTASASGSDYTVYTVQLAPYDLIVQMNSAAGAAVNTRLPNANTVNVYVDSKAAMYNSTPLGTGGTFRFTGLLFNDSGVLRMVCNQVNDGVPQ